MALLRRYKKDLSTEELWGGFSPVFPKRALNFRKEPCFSTEVLNLSAIFTKEPCISTT